ncbi:hypothetical protein DFH11DRAFT_1689341 [Phellopilus nigrolimitatus]|nr:hypothetical protein DFH11DRAFT_1689341 [Phellopilus nigrolimitatus]
MPTIAIEPGSADGKTVQFDKDWSFRNAWRDFSNWVVWVANVINDETLEHPYFIAFALFIVWAWPHLLMLPVWFGKDAYRHMDDHARSAARGLSTPVRRRKRDVFVSRYRSVVNATYEPESRPRPPLFGGTPLSDGNLAIEEERHLPAVLRVIRWSALVWAGYIIGRELYFVLSR